MQQCKEEEEEEKKHDTNKNETNKEYFCFIWTKKNATWNQEEEDWLSGCDPIVILANILKEYNKNRNFTI